MVTSIDASCALYAPFSIESRMHSSCQNSNIESALLRGKFGMFEKINQVVDIPADGASYGLLSLFSASF